MSTYTEFKINRVKEGVKSSTTDVLAEEVPVALVYNGISHIVLMTTPADLAELVLGFSLSEGILQQPSELYDLEIQEVCNGIEVRMEIASSRFQALKERRRNMGGRTGCGLCGIDSLNAVKPVLPFVSRNNNSVKESEIQSALTHFQQYQNLRNLTGSVHGAAWIEQGRVMAAFEDVGRHNALDKLLGWGIQQKVDWRDGFALISSRASYEMVAKAATLGIGCLVAVSAPTAMAVRLAEEAGITLIGFAKLRQFSIYTHPQYIEV